MVTLVVWTQEHQATLDQMGLPLWMALPHYGWPSPSYGLPSDLLYDHTVFPCELLTCSHALLSIDILIGTFSCPSPPLGTFSDDHMHSLLITWGLQWRGAPTALLDQATHQAPPVRRGHTALVEAAFQSSATLGTTVLRAPVTHSLAQVSPAPPRREGLNPSFCTSVNAGLVQWPSDHF